MIPIFIIVKDRTTVLQQCIESYQTIITSPIEIILLDQESTYPGMIDFLHEKEKEGIRVKYLKDTQSNKHSRFPKVVAAINEMIYSEHFKYYVLTDPDIMLSETTAGDILEFYTYFHEKNPGYDAIGPMLEINDIPDYYPFKSDVMTQHKPFWDATGKLRSVGVLEYIEYKDKTCTYQFSPIDTSFALRHGILKNTYAAGAARTRAPYTAKHLDWYIHPDKMTEDQKYYIETSASHAGISHWGGTWFKYPQSIMAFRKKARRPR